MKRLFFMFCQSVLLVLILIKTLRVHLITPHVENIAIRIIYNQKNYNLELEPYTLLSEALDHLDLGEDVDFRKLNLNQVLAHNDVLTIPLVSDTPCVSINTAAVEDLILLTGIGEKTALSIIAHREERGLFQSIDDLQAAKGIGPSKFEKIRDSLCL